MRYLWLRCHSTLSAPVHCRVQVTDEPESLQALKAYPCQPHRHLARPESLHCTREIFDGPVALSAADHVERLRQHEHAHHVKYIPVCHISNRDHGCLINMSSDESFPLLYMLSALRLVDRKMCVRDTGQQAG